MKLDRRQFNQGLVAAATVAAIPLLPTPPQVDGPVQSRHYEMVMLDDVPFPEFQVQLMEHHGRTTLWHVKNLTDLILRIRGFDNRNYQVTRHVFELGPRETYAFFGAITMEPRFELLAQYRWVS